MRDGYIVTGCVLIVVGFLLLASPGEFRRKLGTTVILLASWLLLSVAAPTMEAGLELARRARRRRAIPIGSKVLVHVPALADASVAKGKGIEPRQLPGTVVEHNEAHDSYRIRVDADALTVAFNEPTDEALIVTRFNSEFILVA